jgi:hypothetical protein
MGALTDPANGLPRHTLKFGVFFLSRLSGTEHAHPDAFPRGKSAEY